MQGASDALLVFPTEWLERVLTAGQRCSCHCFAFFPGHLPPNAVWLARAREVRGREAYKGRIDNLTKGGQGGRYEIGARNGGGVLGLTAKVVLIKVLSSEWINYNAKNGRAAYMDLHTV